ncbi:MAG: hypothetical protein N3B18_07845 [Desulfobacterota bacterium]|nr:hypothetical protein [Thermodesulfobacteriota bacterium]
MKYVILLLTIGFFFASCSQSAFAREKTGAQSQVQPWHRVTFLSLKQGSAIQNARFMLHGDGTISFEIKGEPLAVTKNVYKRDGVKFTATVAFELKKEKPYRYVLSFDGYGIADIYGGMATLQEYINISTLTQKLPFLFFATPEAPSEQKGNKPFFLP